MDINEFFDVGAGDALLDYLQEEGLVTESYVSIEKSKGLINENVGIEDNVNRTTTTTSYLGRPIEWNVFKTIYTDYDTYRTVEEIWFALGFLPELFDPGMTAQKQSRSDNMSTQLRRVVKYFRKNLREGREILVSPKERKEAYSKEFEDRRSGEDEEDGYYDERPDERDAFIPGMRNRSTKSTKVMQKINSQDLLPGEFYSDYTRIPKGRWRSWWRFWDKEVSAVKQDKRLFGRAWRRYFVMGYQVSEKLFYEIWYHSIDSTFAIHDHRGNQIHRKFPTLSEAIRGVFNATVQASRRDSEIFTSMNNQIAVSIGRAMTNGLDSFVDEVQDIERKEQEARNRQRLAASVAKDRAEAEKLNKEIENERAAEAKRKENLEASKKILAKIKKGVSSAATSSGAAAVHFGNTAADVSTKAYIEGKLTIDAYAKRIGDVYGVANTPEGKEIYRRMVRGDIDLADYAMEIRSLDAKLKGEENRRADRDERQRREAEEVLKRAEEAAKRGKEEKSKGMLRIPHITESYGVEYLLENAEAIEYQEAALADYVNSSGYKTGIKVIRNEANGRITQRAVKDSVNSDMIDVYDKTRITKGEFDNFSTRWLNVGRSEPIVLPTDKRPFWDRVKSFFSGNRYQADFIVGFSLSNAVNIEVWYITEPNPDYGLKDFSQGDLKMNSIVSSFYVFDVTSGKLLRKYIPYYRNAVQIAMTKISAI